MFPKLWGAVHRNFDDEQSSHFQVIYQTANIDRREDNYPDAIIALHNNFSNWTTQD